MAHTPGFRDRVEAGRALAGALAGYQAEAPVVVGLTRGGVPVAFEVARALEAPFDICVVRKVGAPTQPEFGLGAVAEGGVVVLDPASVAAVGASAEEVRDLVAQKLDEIAARIRTYRKGAAPLDVTGRTVIVVDDGLATGGTARAALRAVRRRGAEKVVLAVPVGAADSRASLRAEADDVVCLFAPADFQAVGL
ncbi:MAG TPA: phosphoribosyltransferase family protein, partial [Minicystis sp.]|nr:phosphoribosyltransferase family protein [Minicystis sp.]